MNNQLLKMLVEPKKIVLVVASASINLILNNIAAQAVTVSGLNWRVEPQKNFAVGETANAKLDFTFNKSFPNEFINFQVEVFHDDRAFTGYGSMGFMVTQPSLYVGSFDPPNVPVSGSFTFTPSSYVGNIAGKSGTFGVLAKIYAQPSGSALASTIGGSASSTLTFTTPTVNVTVGNPVPEPITTLLGSGLALGFGGLLKRQYSRKHKELKDKVIS